MPEIEICGLCKGFNGFVIFDHADMHVTGGKIIGLTGPNGSGKSVLLKCICGLMTPDAGRIMINGKPVLRTDVYQNNIGVSIEKPSFIESFSGLENLKYLAGFRKKVSKEEMLQWMRTFGIYSARNMPVGKYSLGMKQKLAIIQAIMEEQQILLLDEVSNSLDRKSKELLMNLLMKLREEGRLILYVNHDAAEVELLSDEIYEIEEHHICRI